jgi:hypothetical protein
MASENSGSTILLLGAAAVAVYGYTQGWFSKLFGTTTTSTTQTAAQIAAAQAATAQAAAAAAASAAQNSPILPPLGTILNNAPQIALQVAAKDKYILPGPALYSAASPPAGYTAAIDALASEVGGGSGGFYLRNDIAAAVLATVNGLLQAQGLPGLTLGTLTQFPIESLSTVNQIATSAGLSGLGDYQRHMYTRTGRYRPVRVA